MPEPQAEHFHPCNPLAAPTGSLVTVPLQPLQIYSYLGLAAMLLAMRSNHKNYSVAMTMPPVSMIITLTSKRWKCYEAYCENKECKELLH